ncbi:MAG: hypothetical protein ACOYOB_17925 [Myxococcota bacterium]
MTYQIISLGNQTSDLHSGIQIAVANIPVSREDILANCQGSPNLSVARHDRLAQLLNEVSSFRGPAGRRIELLVFPELSLPASWLPMITAWARRRRIGVICGLEHQIRGGEALNEMVVALPFVQSGAHWACAPIHRLKRHYSPREEFMLANLGMRVPDRAGVQYQLFRWRGASFAVYNCFELACIKDRSIFMGKVDFIVVIEYNHDVDYFSNIVEAAARDLHCYVVQVNNSGFGDSRVVSPADARHGTPLQMTGGENTTFLTMALNLKALRAYQRVGYGMQRDSKAFKPTPPGFQIRDVQTRIRLGGRRALA